MTIPKAPSSKIPMQTEIDRIAHLESVVLILTDLVQSLAARAARKLVESDEKGEDDPFLTPQTQFRIPQPNFGAPDKYGKDAEKADSGKTDFGKKTDSGTNGITRKVADYKPLLRKATSHRNGAMLKTAMRTRGIPSAVS